MRQFGSAIVARSLKWLIVVFVIGLAAALLLWPDSKPKGPELTAKERQALEKRAAEISAASLAISCKRAPLRGEARPGSGTELAKKLLTWAGDAAECLNLFPSSGIEGVATDHVDRYAREATPLSADESSRAPGAAEKCAPVIAMLRDAVAHEELCSVRQGQAFDERQDPELNLVRLASVVLFQARVDAASGDKLAAAQLLLDYMRFAQDHARGGVSLIEEMIAVAAIRSVYGQLVALALGPDSVSPAERSELASEVGRLLDVEPVAADLAPAEEAQMIEFSLELAEDSPRGEGEQSRAAWQVGALVLVAVHDYRKTLCPSAASYAQCAEAWSKMSRGTPDELLALVPELESPRMRKELFGALSVSWSGRQKYFRKKAQTVAALIALEAALKSDAEVCPAEPRLEPLGTPIRFDRKGREVVMFAAPLVEGDADLETLRFQCP